MTAVTVEMADMERRLHYSGNCTKRPSTCFPTDYGGMGWGQRPCMVRPKETSLNMSSGSLYGKGLQSQRGFPCMVRLGQTDRQTDRQTKTENDCKYRLNVNEN